MSAAVSEQQQFRKMIETPIPRLVTSLAAPTILTMLITTFYNLADTFFVSRLGTSATGAVGIVFATMAIVQAIGFTIGVGCGSQVSRALGRRDREAANRFGSSALVLALTLGLLLSAAGLLFNSPLMRLLGATPTILPYAREYARYIFLGTFIQCCAIVLNNLLRAEGRAVLSTIGLGFGAVLNIGLDPLFIFGFGMGIAGAAIATLISQVVSFGILTYFFASGRSITKLSYRSVSRNWRDYWLILQIGFSSFCRQGLASASTVALNLSAGSYGDAAVAAMSIVGRVFFFLLSALIGFGQGFQPVAGYNYGARRYDRVREAFRFSVRTGTVFLTAAGALGFWFAPELIGLFGVGDPQVTAIGAAAIRAQCLVLPLQAAIVLSNMLFQSIGKAIQAILISACRQGIYFLPLIFLLPHWFGLTGVEYTQTVSDLCAFLTCLPFLFFFFRDLKTRIARQEAVAVPAEPVRCFAEE